MQTIVIPVGQGRPIDDIIQLVETMGQIFPDQVIRSIDALIIETDIPAAVAIFKQIAGTDIPLNVKKPGSKPAIYECVSCGAPVVKKGNRCKKCAMKLVCEKNRKPLQEVDDEPTN